MLPMGTIMASLMLLGALFANRLPILGVVQKLPQTLLQMVGAIVVAGGAWNVFWYALQHLNEFWGQMALISGVLMLITGAFLLNADWMPVVFRKLRPLTTLGLLLCGLYYGWTIYQL